MKALATGRIKEYLGPWPAIPAGSPPNRGLPGDPAENPDQVGLRMVTGTQPTGHMVCVFRGRLPGRHPNP